MITLNVSDNAVVRIYSITGAEVYNGISPNTIDVSNLEAGIYQVVVTDNGTQSVEKLIIR